MDYFTELKRVKVTLVGFFGELSLGEIDVSDEPILFTTDFTNDNEVWEWASGVMSRTSMAVHNPREVMDFLQSQPDIPGFAPTLVISPSLGGDGEVGRWSFPLTNAFSLEVQKNQDAQARERVIQASQRRERRSWNLLMSMFVALMSLAFLSGVVAAIGAWAS